MNRLLWACLPLLFFFGPALAQAQGIHKIQHVVFIVKENHTYDNYFGQFPGGNGTTTGSIHGKPIALAHAPDSAHDLCHTRRCAWTAYDLGAMDKFETGRRGLASYAQYTQSDIPLYWQLASQYVLADNFFTSALGPSFPNHLITIGAFTGAADNPNGAALGNADEG
jgi:phospholipase C